MDTRFGYSAHSDTEQAFQECCEHLPEASPCCVFLWLNPGYDLELLATLLKAKGWNAVLAGTTAGLIDQGCYRTEGMSLSALYSEHLKVNTWLLDDLQKPQEALRRVSRGVNERYKKRAEGCEMFATLLIDGLSCREEEIASRLYPLLGQVPLIGGSTADGLQFKETHVYYDGQFLSKAAVVALFESMIPFKIFKSQHHRATERKLVVTDIHPGGRNVKELDGRPALETYRKATGLDAEALTPENLSVNSLALKIGDELFVRSIQSMGPNQSLDFYCSLERGSVLTLVRSHEPIQSITDQLDSLEEELGSISFMLSFDCILRRLEFERLGCVPTVEEQLQRSPSTGFCTYGEQYNALHINQTIVGVAFAHLN